MSRPDGVQIPTERKEPPVVADGSNEGTVVHEAGRSRRAVPMRCECRRKCAIGVNKHVREERQRESSADNEGGFAVPARPRKHIIE